jgi:hypothetical protein
MLTLEPVVSPTVPVTGNGVFEIATEPDTVAEPLTGSGNGFTMVTGVDVPGLGSGAWATTGRGLIRLPTVSANATNVTT